MTWLIPGKKDLSEQKELQRPTCSPLDSFTSRGCRGLCVFSLLYANPSMLQLRPIRAKNVASVLLSQIGQESLAAETKLQIGV